MLNASGHGRLIQVKLATKRVQGVMQKRRAALNPWAVNGEGTVVETRRIENGPLSQPPRHFNDQEFSGSCMSSCIGWRVGQKGPIPLNHA
jgi:hypothetical protein